MVLLLSLVFGEILVWVLCSVAGLMVTSGLVSVWVVDVVGGLSLVSSPSKIMVYLGSVNLGFSRKKLDVLGGCGGGPW